MYTTPGIFDKAMSEEPRGSCNTKVVKLTDNSQIHRKGFDTTYATFLSRTVWLGKNVPLANQIQPSRDIKIQNAAHKNVGTGKQPITHTPPPSLAHSQIDQNRSGQKGLDS